MNILRRWSCPTSTTPTSTEYWAISDIDPAELAKFRQLFDAAAKSGPDKTG